jgi:hypothetical protein
VRARLRDLRPAREAGSAAEPVALAVPA